MPLVRQILGTRQHVTHLCPALNPLAQVCQRSLVFSSEFVHKIGSCYTLEGPKGFQLFHKRCGELYDVSWLLKKNAQA